MFNQQRKIQIGSYNFEIAPLVITIIGIIFLTALGCWQLYRLKEKTAFIASMSRNLSNPGNIYDPKTTLTIYQKIKLDGQFLQGNDIYLYGRKAMAPEKEGYYLLSPFMTTKGTVIMIARGWFAAKNKHLIQIPQAQNTHEITGIVLPLEQKRIFIPDNDIKNNVWLTLDHKDLMGHTQQTLENFYLLQIDPTDLPSLVLPISPEGLIKIKNDHLEYALTWFCLAICLGVIFYVYIKQKQIKKI